MMARKVGGGGKAGDGGGRAGDGGGSMDGEEAGEEGEGGGSDSQIANLDGARLRELEVLSYW